ncbi:MAG: hypothetical protein ACYSR0_12425 [Planctomycetota bacterium]|jgi:hypothetical protein
MEKKRKSQYMMDIKNQKVANEINETVSTLEDFSISHKQISLQNPKMLTLTL